MTGIFNIHHIHLDVGELNSELDVGEGLVVHGTGRIETSGEVALNLKIKSLRKPPIVEVEAKVQNQNLADLTPFFEKNVGLLIKGILIKGRGLVALKGNELTSTVWVEYRDLDVTLVKNFERSEITAFFENLGQAIVMSKRNKDKPHDEQTSTIKATMKADETIVSFILRGLKEAAIEVTKQ